jgi:holin-like protein
MLGFVFFVMLFLVGNYLSTRFALPIPGSIIGLGLAFGVLVARGKVDACLKQAADSLLFYLPLMLIPIGVGIVRLVDSPPPAIWKLVMVLVVALVLGAIGTAKIMERALLLRAPARLPPPTSPSEGELR